MIDLDDLAARWAEHDRRLDAQLALNARVLRELKLDRTRAALRGLGWREGSDIAMDVLLFVVLVSYVASRAAAGQVRFVLPGLALCAFLAWSFGTGVWLAQRVARLDFAAPVVGLQRELEILRTVRIRKTKWIFVCAPLLWTPLLVVGLDALGIDAYVHLGARYLAANLAFGLAVIPLFLWIARRPRVARSRLFGRLADDLAGRSLGRARAELASLAAFERGE
jgi:hypothetical protein